MRETVIYDLLMLSAILGILFLIRVPYIDLLIAFICILVYCYKRKGIKNELGLHEPQPVVKTIAIAAGLAICIVPITYFALLPIIEKITGYALGLGIFDALSGNTRLLFISLALGWLVGGILEEIIFRAFMISRFTNFLPNNVGVFLGVILPSALFGYLHTYQGPTGQIITGFLGLILAIIFVLNKRNIWLNIFTHGFINTFSMLLLYFDLIKIS